MKVKHFEVKIQVKEEKKFRWKKRKKRFVVRMGVVTEDVFDTKTLTKH